MIGQSEELSSYTSMSSRTSCGSSGFASSTASRTFCSASLMSTEGLNSRTTVLTPSLEVDDISSTSATDFNCVSSLRVTRFSMSSGLVP